MTPEEKIELEKPGVNRSHHKFSVNENFMKVVISCGGLCVIRRQNGFDKFSVIMDIDLVDAMALLDVIDNLRECGAIDMYRQYHDLGVKEHNERIEKLRKTQ